MKRIIALLAMALLPNMALNASNYPSDYLNQSAVVVAQGPAFMAEVNTVTNGKKYAIGYKKTGMLAEADEVNAYIRTTYKLIGQWGVVTQTSERKLKLLREWNGAGFITGEILQYASNGTDGLIFVPPNALTYNTIEIEKIEFAFYVDNQWDSNNGMNYIVDSRMLYSAGVRFRSSYASGSIAVDTWNFIVDQMKK